MGGLSQPRTYPANCGAWMPGALRDLVIAPLEKTESSSDKIESPDAVR